MRKNNLLGAVATILGCIIGAGILGIPYVVSRAGFLIGAVQIILIGLTILLINLMCGEIVLRTKAKHQLCGLAEKYLGKRGKIAMLISMILGLYGAMIAYIIGEGAVLSAILGNSSTTDSIIFFLIIAAILYFGIKALMASEKFLLFLKAAVFLIVIGIIVLAGRFNPSNIITFNLRYAFLPYGTVLFAYLGFISIPEAREELEKNKILLKKAILLGSIMPIIVYLLFAMVVVAATGSSTTEVATVELGSLLGTFPFILINFFAILAMATAALAVGFALKEMYIYDFKIKKNYAFLLAVFPPIILYLAGIKSFISVLGITGALTGSLSGILIILMHSEAKISSERTPEYEIKIPSEVKALLIFALGAGVVIEVIFILGII